MPYGSPMRQRDGPLPRRTAVLRHASRGLQRADGVRVCAHAIAPPHTLPQEEAQHARLRRAHAPPRWLESAHALWEPTVPAGPSPSVIGRDPTCQPRFPTSRRSSRVRTRDRTTARSPSGGGAARALAACARPPVLIRVSLYPTEAHWASGTALSVGARPCSDMQAAVSNEQAEFACAHT